MRHWVGIEAAGPLFEDGAGWVGQSEGDSLLPVHADGNADRAETGKRCPSGHGPALRPHFPHLG